MINLLASEKTLNKSMVINPFFRVLQIGRSDHFVASLWHLESKVDNIMVKDGNSV